MRLIYKNKYGQLELEVMGEYRAVSTIHCRDINETRELARPNPYRGLLNY